MLFKVDVFESENLAGGLASGIKYDGFDWAIEPFYHHWFHNESGIIKLAKEHDLINRIKIFSPNTSFFLDGEIRQFDRPHHILMYPGLSIIDRYRLATKLASLKLSKSWKYYEKFTAEEWLIKNMGENVYEKMWKPMLIAKCQIITIRLIWLGFGQESMSGLRNSCIRKEGFNILIIK